MLRKLITIILAVSLLASLVVSASAVSGTSGNNSVADSPGIVNLLKDAVFTRRVFDSSGFLMRSEVTSDPFMRTSFASFELEWNPSVYMKCKDYFLSFSIPSFVSFKLYVNGSSIKTTFSGGSGVVSYYCSDVLVAAETVKIVFTNSKPSEAYSNPTGICMFIGNILDTFPCYSGSAGCDVIVSDYKDGLNYYYSQTFTEVFPYELYDDSLTVYFDVISGADDYESIQPYLIIPCSQFNSDIIKYFYVNVTTFDSIRSCTAVLSNYSDPILNPLTDDVGLQVNLTGYETDYGSGSQIFDYGSYGYTVQVDLASRSVRNKYLHIYFDIPTVQYDSSSRDIAKFAVWNSSYVIDYYSDTNIYAKIAAYIYQLHYDLGDQLELNVEIYDKIADIHILMDSLISAVNDNSEVLNSILSSLESVSGLLTESNHLLDLILNAVKSNNNLDLLDSIFRAVSDAGNYLSAIESWLNSYDPEPDSDLSISIGQLKKDRQDIEEQLQILETVPKLTVDEMGEVLQYVESVGSDVSGDVNVNPGNDDSWLLEPVTLSTPFGYIFNGSNDVSALIGQMLLLAASLALAGYVLFGKRG